VIDVAKPKTIFAADLFCGAGGTSTGMLEAMNELGMTAQLLAINHWEVAIATHSLNHPEVMHRCESVDGADPRLLVPGGRLDLLWASPECFVADTMILTDQGLVPIQDVVVGMQVLSHMGVWRRVTSTMSKTAETIIVKGQGHAGLETTSEHPFLARRQGQSWDNSIQQYRRTFSDPEWIVAGDLTSTTTRWATPTSYEKLSIPSVGGRPMPLEDPDFWWLVGRWVADGTVRLRPEGGAEICICAGDHDADAVWDRLQKWQPLGPQRAIAGELRWRRRRVRTAWLFEAGHQCLAMWLVQHFGKLAHGKKIPAWLLSADSSVRSSFLTGYLSGDGHIGPRKSSASTVSKNLAIGIRLLVETLGFRAGLSFNKQHTHTIEGRKVNVRDIWTVRWETVASARSAFEENGHAWSLVKSIAPTGETKPVYNLSVEIDESYVADGIVVHNCTGHSNARGGKPTNEQSRATAWHVLRWAEALDISVILVENVPEFRKWGPLHTQCTCKVPPSVEPFPTFQEWYAKTKDLGGTRKEYLELKKLHGKHETACLFGKPIKAKEGTYYRNFLRNLRVLGYQVDERLLNAADYGDATTRIRLFIQAKKGKRPSWPAPTHLASDGLGLYPDAQKWRTAREIIDWKLKGQSIYDRKKPLAPNTMARIYAGLRKFCGLPFIVHQFSEQGPRSVDVPLGAITTTSRGVGVAESFIVNMKGKSDAADIDRPLPTQTGTAHLYKADAWIVPQFGEREGQSPRTHSIDAPLPSPTSHGAGALVEAFVIGAGGPTGSGRPQSINKPLGTVLSDDHHALIDPFLVKFYEGSDAVSIDKPVPAITANYEHLGLAEPFLVVLRNHCDARSIDGPIPALTANGGHIGIADACIVPVTHQGGEERSHSVDMPLPAITGAHRGELALIQPYLTKYHGSHRGRTDGDDRVLSVDNPVPAIDTSNRVAVAEPFLVHYCNGGDAHSVDEPLHTQTTRDRFALVAPQFVEALGIDKGDIVGWLDIRFRMLQPHELAAAMGFPKGYKFSGNREAQIKQIGNAVCVNLAKELVKAALGVGAAA